LLFVVVVSIACMSVLVVGQVLIFGTNSSNTTVKWQYVSNTAAMRTTALVDIPVAAYGHQ